jgi:hypothetical protein
MDKLCLSHVAKVYACEPFDHSGGRYFAVLQEGHIKTLQEEVACRLNRDMTFTTEELLYLIRTLFETLNRLFEQGLCYFLDSNKVLYCPRSSFQGTFKVKIGSIWSCFRPNPSDLPLYANQSIACLRLLSNFIVSYFPASSSASLNLYFDEYIPRSLLIAAIPPAEEEKVAVEPVYAEEKAQQSVIESTGDAKTAETYLGRQSEVNQPSKMAKSRIVDEEDETESELRPYSCKACQCTLI